MAYNPDSQPATISYGATTVSAWTYTPSGQVSASTHYNLDAAGTSQGTVTKAFSYDTQGRPLTTGWTIPGLAGTQTIATTYREAGGTETVTYPGAHTVTTTYDPLEQPNAMVSNQAGTTVAGTAYTADGQVSVITRGGQNWPVTNHALINTRYDYQPWSGRLTGITSNGLDVADAVGDEITRLYRAAYGRNPDPVGYNHSLYQAANATPTANIAQTFAESAEFTTKWAGYVDPWDATPHDVATNTGFMNWAHGHILGWAPAQRTYIGVWIGRLDNGSWTRGQVLSYFANYADALTNPNIGGSRRHHRTGGGHECDRRRGPRPRIPVGPGGEPGQDR